MSVGLPTSRLFGLDFVSVPSTSVVADRIMAEIVDGEGAGWRLVVTPNVDHIVRYERHAEEAEVARAATLVLPDGLPIVWASRIVGHPLEARLTGVELFADLFPVLARRGVPTLVVAPNQDVARELRAQHPALTTIVPPYVEMDDVEGLDAIARDVADVVLASGARVVVVGLSGAKGHRLGDRLLAQSPAPPAPGPFVLMVGAAPEFHLGHIRRAPSWMQRAGLEWLYRLAHEPLRLARRYLVDDVAFAGLVWGEWRRSRRRRGASGVQDDG